MCIRDRSNSRIMTSNNKDHPMIGWTENIQNLIFQTVVTRLIEWIARYFVDIDYLTADWRVPPVVVSRLKNSLINGASDKEVTVAFVEIILSE